MPELTVRGRRLGYEVQPSTFDKTSLAVLFIHGSGGDREDWRQQLEGLNSPASMIALELPGHGASSPPGETSVPGYALWVTDFVETLGLEKVVVVGCSLGSAITQTLALAPRPWLVGLGLVGAGARLKVHPQFLAGLKQNPQTALDLLADFCLSNSPDNALREELRRKYSSISADLVHDDLYACDNFDVMDKVNQIVLPTCIIVGHDDRLTPLKYSEFLHKAIRGSRLEVISGAGHLVMVEKPREFNRALVSFIESLPDH